MKPKAAKCHLIDLAEPLLTFHGLIMRCGEVIHEAECVFLFTEGMIVVWPTQTCQKCLHLEPKGEEKRTYLYGLAEAQPMRFEESA